MPEEEIVSVIGPNTPAVVMDPAIGILRIQQVGATTQILAPPSKVNNISQNCREHHYTPC